MKKIVIVGSGPVGGFMAVLCALLGYIVVVYEKREEFTRNINLKIESIFFKEVHEMLLRLNISNDFFLALHSFLNDQNNRILIKDLEKRFSQEAKLLGALYITREVKNFDELLQEHEISNPIILDCTGRNSQIRINEFGPDGNNLVTVPLQNAMYINFKAKVNGSLSLYQSMKYIKNIKLSEVIVSKKQGENGFSNITIPAFITGELARTFDKEFPDINRSPVNPFSTAFSVSKSIFFPISSMLGNLIVDGCKIDLNTVAVKKIEISCGYARKRSRDDLVCLGDSAVHLAFFKSLNIGLRHGLELFVRFSIMRNVRNFTLDVLSEFKRDNPFLHPIKFYHTDGENVFLVITRLVWFGCFSYCYTNRKTERLTNQMGVTEDKIDHIREELNRKLRSWSFLLIDFESKRDQDILHEIRSQKEKNVLYDHTSWVIGLNGKSLIKVSELARAVKGRNLLVEKDFETLFTIFEERRNVINWFSKEESQASLSVEVIKMLLIETSNNNFKELLDICSSKSLSAEEKLNLLMFASERVRLKTNKLGLIMGASASGVGGYNTSDNTKIQFIWQIVKNELATKNDSTNKTETDSD